MKVLSQSIKHFFMNQGYVIVSSIDSNGSISNSCKGIVRIDSEGRVYLLDLYHGRTSKNLNLNSNISITAIDEHKFMGYCLQGRAHIIKKSDISPEIVKAWEERITSRLTKRLIKNIKEEKGHPRHPEIMLPEPRYMIMMEVQEIIDLTPQHLK